MRNQQCMQPVIRLWAESQDYYCQASLASEQHSAIQDGQQMTLVPAALVAKK